MTGTAATEAAGILRHLQDGTSSRSRPTSRSAATTTTTRSTRTSREKYAAIVKTDRGMPARRGQPILVGTVSIEKSELLSELPQEGRSIPHSVLNARYHEQEAHDRRPGRPSRRRDHRHQHGRPRHRHPARRQRRHAASTMSSPSVRRPRARRPRITPRSRAEIEAEQREGQRGRRPVRARHRAPREPPHRQPAARPLRPSGRPRRLASSSSPGGRPAAHLRPATGWTRMLQRLGLEDGEAIAHQWLTKAIETAQKKVEARNYEIRKQLLKYDDVMNDQRKVVYEQRAEIMDAEDVSDDRARCATTPSTTSSSTPPAGRGLCRAVGRRRPARARSAACSTSTCRSTTGRRRRASPTRRSRSASRRAADAKMAPEGRQLRSRD